MNALFARLSLKRSVFLVFIGGFLPIMYIIFLLVYNYQDNAALQASSIKRYKLDVEKQAAMLGYFFLERKYDIRTMADSLEVGTFFTNRAMGMSEQYGLKVSLFSIRQMMSGAMKNKTIDKDPIYKKFIFVDANKRVLVNTDSGGSTLNVPSLLEKLDNIRNEPEIVLGKTLHGYEILLATPCFFKKKCSGWIMTWLDLKTLHKNFMGFSPEVSTRVSCLTFKNGTVIQLVNIVNPDFPWARFQKTIAAVTGLELISIPGAAAKGESLLITRIQIRTLPLFLTVYVAKREIFGHLGAWPPLAGVGALIVLVVLGLLFFINTNTKHLVLTARIDESKKQQDLLTAKNSELKAEIIKREQAELFLKENEERYRRLFEFSSDAILILKEAVVVDCNQKTSELLRLDREEIIGREFYTFSPEKQPDGRVSKTECVIKRGNVAAGSQHFEWTLKTPDDKPINTEISMTVLSLKADTLIQLIIRDITERKRTQEILVQTEKMMAVGGLAAGMAHEINNPLGVILQANQNIGRRLGTQLTKNYETAHSLGLDLDQLQKYLHRKSIYNYVESIQSAGERAAKIVKSMLEFGRASEYSKKQLNNLNDILDNVIEMASTDYDLKKKFDFKNIQIDRFYSDIGMIMCEKTEIGQVFLNIIKNAAQAMHGVATEKPRLIICTNRIAEGIRVTIEDNGPGISKLVQKQIFEPFFTTKPVGEGTGLGLSVSYFIITSHYSGNVIVESEKDKGGTRFIIELPVS